MEISTKYELAEKVDIPELKVGGRVIAFFYQSELQYLARYFDNGEATDAYF